MHIISNVLCSMCWVMYNHLQGATLFEKYSWSALKAMSEMVTAGEHITATCLDITESVVATKQSQESLSQIEFDDKLHDSGRGNAFCTAFQLMCCT